MVAKRVVQVEVGATDAELATDALWQADPSAVTQDDLGDGRTRLTADVADPSRIGPLPVGARLSEIEIDDDAHLDRWRDWATPVRAGRRVVLHPAWLPTVGADDDLVVLLDPGRTFGSGSHPSTRLVVAALEAHCGPGQRVLDVGTGSGVLAVVAALLGAAEVQAVDIDVAAPAVVRANAEANGVRDRVAASTTPVTDVTGTFDLVLANIGAGVLRGLADELRARVAPGGLLVLSGLLAGQADAVVACLVDLTELARSAEDEWVAVVLRAPG